MNNMTLLSGTSNRPLARDIAKHVKTSLGDVEITRFIDNECRVYVKEDVTNKRVFVVQSLSEVADQHLMELCLMGQALKSLHAEHVTAIIPWMGYSKQDKEFRRGEAVSAQLVAKFIETAGFDRVITCELHSENILPYFRIPVTELSTHTLFERVVNTHTDVVVSPDTGGKKRSERFAKELGLPIAYLTKKRSGAKVTVTGISGRVSGKDCIIFDDIVNTGETAVQTSAYLRKHGAKHVSLLATHGVLAGDASERLSESHIDNVVITDTIDIPKQKRFSKLHIISVAALIANAIMGE